MSDDYDCIVLGLGGLGSAAAYRLASRGQRVLGLEQFQLAHERGSSHDHSRIIRLTYHTAGYVKLCKAAYQAWAEVERDAGESLILKSGNIEIFPSGGAIPIANYTDSLETCGVRYERLDAEEAMRRWPQFRLDDVAVIFQEDGGIAPAMRCTRTHQRLARQHGATLRDDCRIASIEDRGGEISVHTASATYNCAHLIVTAGAWSREVLAQLGWIVPLTVTQEQVTYFVPPKLDDFLPDRFPVWEWLDDSTFYGFPVFGEKATKVASDASGPEVTVDTRTFEPDPARVTQLTDFLSRTIPGMVGPALYSKTCLYTLTPDRDFVIDRVPGHPAIAAVIDAGHAFKFAALIGSILADLAVDGTTEHDIAAFAAQRPVLAMDNPPRQHLM